MFQDMKINLKIFFDLYSSEMRKNPHPRNLENKIRMESIMEVNPSHEAERARPADRDIENAILGALGKQPDVSFSQVREHMPTLGQVPEGVLRRAIWRLVDRGEVVLKRDQHLALRVE